MNGNEPVRNGDDRAQTLPDFVVAVAVFLLAITFVVAFVPQLTAPYEEQERPIMAERIASDLSGALLAESGTSIRVNESCTRAFFRQTNASGCPFDPTKATTEQLGVESHYVVNVTLERNVSGGPEPEILCADDDTIGPCGSERLAIGPPVPEGDRSVAVARRTVHVDGEAAVLEVRVWT